MLFGVFVNGKVVCLVSRRFILEFNLRRWVVWRVGDWCVPFCSNVHANMYRCWELGVAFAVKGYVFCCRCICLVLIFAFLFGAKFYFEWLQHVSHVINYARMLVLLCLFLISVSFRIMNFGVWYFCWLSCSFCVFVCACVVCVFRFIYVWGLLGQHWKQCFVVSIQALVMLRRLFWCFVVVHLFFFCWRHWSPHVRFSFLLCCCYYVVCILDLYRLHKPLARKPWLTVYRAHQRRIFAGPEISKKLLRLIVS